MEDEPTTTTVNVGIATAVVAISSAQDRMVTVIPLITARKASAHLITPMQHSQRFPQGSAPSTLVAPLTTIKEALGIDAAMVATSDAHAPTVISAPLAMDTMNTIEVTDMDTTTVSRISLADTARMPITALSTTATEMHGISVEMGGITGVSAPIRHR